MSSHPQAGYNLTGGASAATVMSTPEFDPSQWQIPTGPAGAIYHLKRALSSEIRTKHADHLKWRAWQGQVEAAEADWEARNEAARAKWQEVCSQLREELDARNKVAELEHKQSLVQTMMNMGVHPVVVFVNWKSGGKTTLAAYVGTIMSDLSGRSSMLLPSTANSKTATSGRITGLLGNHLTLLEFEQNLDTITTPRALGKRAAHTKEGLIVIVEDRQGNINQKRFNPERYEPVMRRSFALTGACLLLDLGNDDFNEDEIPLMAARAADVIVCTATNTAPTSHATMQESIDTLKTDLYDGNVEPMEDRLPGEYRPTADKLQHGLVVISGVKPEDGEYDFEALRTGGAHDISQRRPVAWEGQGCTVQYDDYVKGAHNELTTVNLEGIHPDTYEDYLDVTLGILYEGARALNIDVSDLPEFVPEQLGDLPEFNAPPREEIPEPDYASNRSA